MQGKAQVIRGDARRLPLADDSVDLVISSPPYFALRSYQDGGEHYAGQMGSEATPAEFVDALVEVTRECVRVLKPCGSLWINLGDKYAGSAGDQGGKGRQADIHGYQYRSGKSDAANLQSARIEYGWGGVRPKSLMGIPWRYALRCIDDLGLILRAEVIWSKPNGLPESVTDRVRRSHEQWFHFTLQPRYYSAVDEIREAHIYPNDLRHLRGGRRSINPDGTDGGGNTSTCNPLGKLPGSVWTIPTEPLTVPDHLGVDHFAAFPTEWPRRIIQGWSPPGICTACGEGRAPTSSTSYVKTRGDSYARGQKGPVPGHHSWEGAPNLSKIVAITGYACACPEPTAPTRPSVVLDPFGGTGTTALAALALGRHGITLDMSADYSRLARWRTTDQRQLAGAMRILKPAVQVDGQASMFDFLEEAAE